jgi:sporulation protein YtfJ
MGHPIEGLMKTTMDSLKEMIDVNTIVGDAVETKDGNIIIPISKVTIGFASGGAEYCKDSKSVENKDNFPFGGGSGAGMCVQPVAFLIVKDNTVKLLPVKHANSIERIVDSVPELLDELMDMLRKDKGNKNKSEATNLSNASSEISENEAEHADI